MTTFDMCFQLLVHHVVLNHAKNKHQTKLNTIYINFFNNNNNNDNNVLLLVKLRILQAANRRRSSIEQHSTFASIYQFHVHILKLKS
jgi:hypothetical protein